MRAVSFNPEAASLMGVNVNVRHQLHVWPGSALAAAGGILWAYNFPNIDPLMGVRRDHGVCRGGARGHRQHPRRGARRPAHRRASKHSPRRQPLLDVDATAIAFLILILILLFKPAGLLGKTATGESLMKTSNIQHPTSRGKHQWNINDWSLLEFLAAWSSWACSRQTATGVDVFCAPENSFFIR
jgi:hypothetical protein